MARGRSFQRRGDSVARRRRVWAREQHVHVGITQAAPVASSMLLTYESVAPGHGTAVGTTIGAVKVQLSITRSAGATVDPGLLWGLIVAPRSVESVDINPADFTPVTAMAHLDWMMWTWQGLNGLAFTQTYDVRSQRKLQEIGQTFWLAVGVPYAGDTFSVRALTSTLLLLP